MRGDNMKLILTDVEKKANTWLELDNESIGTIVKSTALMIKETSTGMNKIYHMSAAMILIDAAIEINAERLTETIEGLTIKGVNKGNWKVIIEKVK